MHFHKSLRLLVTGLVVAGSTLLPATGYGAEGSRAKDKLVITKSIYKIEVPEIRAARNNDTLSIQADFVNDGTVDKHVYYRFRWLDVDGNQIGNGESWKQLLLLGRGRETVKGVAPSPKADDFQIELNVQSKSR